MVSQLEQDKGLMLPGPDMVQRHLQLKTAEIYSLLQKIYSCITYQHSLSPRGAKAQNSLISLLEKMRTLQEKRRAARRSRLPLFTNTP